MKRILYKTGLIFLVTALVLSRSFYVNSAEDVEETVKRQIEYTKDRMNQHKQELSNVLSQFAKNPTSELYIRIQELQRNVAKEKKILDSLNVALREAKAATSWWTIVEEMSKESSLISAGATAVAGVYEAGKWIFGPSQEDIFGEGWEQVESLNANLVNEARKIREEANAIAAGLTQIDALISSGAGSEALDKLRDDMTKRLKDLEKRKELVQKNIRFLIRVYRAEKENLPAATIFWGEDYMGRYVKVMMESVDLGNLVDYAWDLAKGNLPKALAKFVKPMVQTAIGDYLAKAKGGNNLTPQIIDDLTFSILFSPTGKNLEKFATDKLKSETTRKVLEVTAQGIVEAEAQLLYASTHKAIWEATKKEIAALPKDFNFADQKDLIIKRTENIVKDTASKLQSTAKEKLGRAINTAKIIKDIWDVVLKDAIQAYLVSDEFTSAVKAANEACAGYREQWRKMKDEMILTEDEYVNSKWFSQSRAPAQVPKGAVDPLTAKREELSTLDAETTAKVSEQLEEAIETYGGKEGKPAPEPGNMDLEELQQIEEEMFKLVLEGKLPLDKVKIPDVYNLTAKKMYTPCYEQNKKNAEAFNKAWPEEKCYFREEISACNADPECRRENLADPGRWERKRQQCRKERDEAYLNQVSRPGEQCVKEVGEKYFAYITRRAQNIQNIYNQLEKEYKKIVEKAKEVAGPATDWLQTYKNEFEKLESLSNNVELLAASEIDLSNAFKIKMPPDLPSTVPLGGQQIIPEEYNVTQVKEALSRLNKALPFVPEIEKLKEPLEKVDFIIEDIAAFLEENPWLKIYDNRGMPVPAPVVYKVVKPSSAAEERRFGTGLPTSYTSIGTPQSLVTLSEPQEVISAEERQLFQQIIYKNPNTYQEMLNKLLSITVIAKSNYYRNLSDFSPDKGYSLYKEAISAYNNAVNQANLVNKLFAEAEEIYRQSSNIGEIVSFYENNFKHWQVMRKINPNLAAKTLGQDTEQFKERVDRYEKQIQSARAQVVLPDVDNIKREIEKFSEAVKVYRQSFENYYQYIAQYFKERQFFPVFEMPDLLYYKMRADNIYIFSEEYSSNFKKAADGLQEMKTALEEMKSADRIYITAITQANAEKEKIVEDFIAFYKSNPDKIDECLRKIEETKKAVQNVVMPVDYQYDHQLPKSVRDEALKLRMADYLGKLIPIEEELKKKGLKEATRKAFVAYQIQNARLNTYSLASASGDVVLLPGDLKEGTIEIQGWFPHLDRVSKVLFSEDGGRSWQELAKEQMFTASFVPVPEKLYEPLIKLVTEDYEEFQIKVFPNIHGIIFRNQDYNQLVAETLKQIAEAYETRNLSLFSSYISRDYLGNKTFLEEGVRFDFDLFLDIKLKIYINRIEKRAGMFVAETKWDKSQTVRKTGQQQRTSGNTTFMFVLEEGKMKIKNLRGNLIYATLSPEIAQASGLSQSVVEEVRTARDERNPVQPGAGETEESGGVATSSMLTVQYSPTLDVPGWPGIGFDFTGNVAVQASSPLSDVDFESNLIFPYQFQEVSQSFNSITEAPSSGYSNANLVNGVGKVFVFITQEGYYGKMEVLTLTDLGGGDFRLTFKFAVQTDGSRNLQTQ